MALATATTPLSYAFADAICEIVTTIPTASIGMPFFILEPDPKG